MPVNKPDPPPASSRPVRPINPGNLPILVAGDKPAAPGELLTEIADSGATIAPKDFQPIIIGELHPVQADYLRLWAEVNARDYRVIVWQDPHSLAAQELADFIIDQTDDSISRARAEVSPTDVRTNRAEQFREHAYSFLKRVIQNGDWSGAIRAYLLDQGEPGRVAVLDQLIEHQNQLYKDFKGRGFDVRDINTLNTTPEWQKRYELALYRYGNDVEATRLVNLHLEYHQGGVFPDLRTLSKVVDTVFTSAQLPDLPPEQARWANYAKVQAILDQFPNFTGEHSARYQAAVNDGYTNYLQLLQESDLPAAREAASIITTAVAGLNPSELLAGLGAVDVGGELGVRLGITDGIGRKKPLFVVSRKGAPALLEVAMDLQHAYGFIDQFDYIYRQGLARYRENNPAANALAKQAEKKLESDVGAYFDQRYPSSSALEIAHYYDGITSHRRGYVYAGFDPGGEIGGFQLHQRGLRKKAQTGSVLPSFDKATMGFTGFTAGTEEMEVRGGSRFHKSAEYVDISNYDSLLFIQIQSDRVITEGTAALFAKSGSGKARRFNSQWVRITSRNGEIEFVDGREIRLTDNSKVIVTSHGNFLQGLGRQPGFGIMAGMDKSEVAAIIAREIPEGVKPKLVFASCATEDCRQLQLRKGRPRTLTEEDVQVVPGGVTWGSFVVDVIDDLARVHNRYVQSATARSRSLYPSAAGTKLIDVGFERGLPEVQNKPDLGRLDITPSYNHQGRLIRAFIKVKEAPIGGTKRVGLGRFVLNGFSSSETPNAPVISLDGVVETTLLSITSPDLQTFLNRLSSDLIRGRGILPADITPLMLAMQEAREIGRIMVADLSTLKVAGVQAAVDLAGRSANPTEWLEKLNAFLEAKQALTTWLEQQPDSLVAFRRLQERALNDGFAFYTADPASSDGAAFINHDSVESHSVIQRDSLEVATCGGTRARRQACSEEEITEQAREAVDGLTLLSDDETRILVGNSAEDIALRTTEPDSALAKVQKGIHDFRRSSTSQRIADHEGYHTIIVLDSDDSSKSAATALAQNTNEETRVLSFRRDGRGNPVLLAEDGHVVTMVEGGSRNRVSLVGTTDTLGAYFPEDLSAGVRALVRGETVASVTVHPVLEAGEDFSLSASFSELGVTDRNSPWRDTTKVVRLHALQEEDGKVLETNTMQVGEPGVRESYFLDGQHVRETFGINPSRLPGTLVSELQNRFEEFRQQGLDALENAWSQGTLDYVAKLQQMTERYRLFKQALERIYINDPTLTADNFVPVLSTLTLEGEGEWSLKFVPSTEDGYAIDRARTITITDPVIPDYIHFYNEKLGITRRGMNFSHEPRPQFANTEEAREAGLEFVDTLGWGLAAQVFISILLQKKQPKQEEEVPADLKKIILAHTVVSLIFGSKVILTAGLDIFKYYRALSTGEIISLPERIASSLSRSAENVGGAVGASLGAAAKSVRAIGAVVDGALILVSIGLDIAEILKSDTKEGKIIAGVQLGIDSVSLGVTVATVALEVAGFSTAAGVLAVVTLPLTAIAVGAPAIAGNLLTNKAKFKWVASYFTQVYRDLRMEGLYHPTSEDYPNNTLNLAYRWNGTDNVALLGTWDNINLVTGELDYGSIKFEQVVGGSEHTNCYYWGGGPGPATRDAYNNELPYFNILDVSSVIKYLNKDSVVPSQSNGKVVNGLVLPSSQNWEVDWDSNQDVPGALDKCGSGSHCLGQKLLDKAGDSGKFKFRWLATVVSSEGLIGFDKTLDCITHKTSGYHCPTRTVRVTLQPRNTTIFTPDNKYKNIHYRLYGTGNDVYYIARTYQLDSISSSGHDHWILQDYNLHVGKLRSRLNESPPVLSTSSKDITLYNFNTPILMVDSNQDRPYNYQIDVRSGSVIERTDPIKLENYGARKILVDTYNNPEARARENVRRFDYLIDDFYKHNWIDFLASGVYPLGTNLGIPNGYYGIVHNEEILYAGLSADVYKIPPRPDGYSKETYPDLETVLGVMAEKPNAHFIASHLRFIDQRANNISTVGDFLGDDAREMRGGGNFSTAITILDKMDLMAYNFSGKVQLEKGFHQFLVGADDGFRLQINKQTVSSTNSTQSIAGFNFDNRDRRSRPHPPPPIQLINANVTIPVAGLYDFELLYWAGIGEQYLQVDLNSQIDHRREGYHLNATRLYNSREPLPPDLQPELPFDTQPVAGWPDFGYFLYSPEYKNFFYRQPFNSINYDHTLLKLPGWYDAANFNASFGTYIKDTNLFVNSNTHVQYKLEITMDHPDSLARPVLRPRYMEWNDGYFHGQVSEVMKDATSRNQTITPAGVFKSEVASGGGNAKFCTLGFLDQKGRGGQGRVGVFGATGEPLRGLHVDIYNLSDENDNSYTFRQALKQMEGVPQATYIATESWGNTLFSEGTTLEQVIPASDLPSLQAFDSRANPRGWNVRTMLFRFHGLIRMRKRFYNNRQYLYILRVVVSAADDNYKINISGSDKVSSHSVLPECRNMPEINCEWDYYAVNQSGLYEFELIYWQNHNNFKLHVYLYEYSASRLEPDDWQITPLPFYDHVRQHSLKPSDEITLKHAVVGSDAYFNARGHSRFAEAIRQTKCLADQSQEEQNTPLTIVHIIRDGNNDHYITFRPEDRRIYLNSCSGDDDFANTTPLALDFLHKTDHLYLTHAQASPGGIEITTEQGVILAINDALLLNATTVTPQPRIFLHEAPLYWYHVTGFARNSWLGWDLSITELEQRIWSELQRFPESVLAHSPPALPIVSNPEYLVRNNSNLTQEVDYASAPCPVKANSWYITSAERIFGFDPEYAVFGFDTDRGWLFATNEENRIFYLQIPDNHTSDTATEDDRGCPQPAVFNPHQIDLQRTWYLSHQVWGQDAQGRLYQVNREGQTLLGIDLQGWPFLWGLGNISISSITSLLDPLVNRLVHDTPKEHTKIASQLVLSLPKNISNTTYQAWYRTEDTVLSEKGSFIFRGKELVSFLGSTIATAISGLRDSIAWFFSPDSGTLYRQEGDTQTPVGNYDLVQLLGEGSSLVMMGTEGNDSMESVTIGRTDGYAVLYLDGLGGTDHYRITRQALSHYESIVIHNAVLTLSDNNVTQPQAPADTNDISIDAMANEFIISRVNDSLMLQHHPTRHSILLSSSLRVAPDNGTGPANTTQGQSLYEWADEHTIVSLDGLVASNEELLHSLAGLPAGYPRYLPLEVRRFGEGQTTTIPLWPGYPTLLDGDNLPPPVPEVGNSSLTLSFQAGNDTIGLYFPDYSYGAGAAADTLFYRHNQSMPYIPLLYLESGNPSFGFSHNDLNEYRPLTQTPDAGTVSCMAVEQLGRSWFIEQDHSQPLSAASGFWNHTGTDQQHFIFVPKKSGQQPEQLRVGWHWIIDEQSPEGDGCVTIAQSTEGGAGLSPGIPL